MSQAATEWKLNSSSLEKGMLIRRQGLDEALEVLKVHNGNAKIKLPDGKTTTIRANSPVEYSWPETVAKPPAIETGAPTDTNLDTDNDRTDAESADWTADWSQLDPSQTIMILGENDDFTVLRKTDSAARVKNNTTAAITSITVGHKFRVLSGKIEAKPQPETKTKTETESRPGTKTRRKPVPQPDPEPLIEDEPEDDLDRDIDQEDEDSEEAPPDIQADIDHEFGNGDDGEDEEEDTEDEETNGADDEDDESDYENDTNDQKEETLPNPARSPKNTVRPSADPEWLTVAQLSESTGHGVPKINTLRKKGEIPKKLFKEDPDDKRRMLYHISLIDKLQSVPKGKARSSKGGRKAAAGRQGGATKNGPISVSRWEAVESPTNTGSPSKGRSAVTQSIGNTGSLDAQLGSAIETAQAQIAVLQSVIDGLMAQREQLRMWS